MNTHRQSGITLVELIAALALLGIIIGASAMFLGTGISGFGISRENSEAALQAKPLIHLLSVKMSDMVEITCFTANSAVTYVNTADDTETVSITPDSIKFNGGTLIDDVKNTSLTLTTGPGGEIEEVVLSFDIEIGVTASTTGLVDKTFTITSSPRTLISTYTACSAS